MMVRCRRRRVGTQTAGAVGAGGGPGVRSRSSSRPPSGRGWLAGIVADGIGLDFGEAFIGNIGDGGVHDFTAVGDVVNTASRLQSQAAGGEVVVSDRVARFLDPIPGVAEEMALKGKQLPVLARRVTWFSGP